MVAAFKAVFNNLHVHKKILMKKISLLLGVALFSAATMSAQSAKSVLPKNWHLQDREKTEIYGISLNKAYEFVDQKKLKSKQVVVLVIDGGIDSLHKHFKPFWGHNQKKPPANGIDDDKNG